MEVKFYNQNIDEQPIELLFIPVLQDKDQIAKTVADLRYEEERLILSRIKKENFTAKHNQLFTIHGNDFTVVLVGFGKEKKVSTEDWRQAAGNIVGYLKNYKATKIALVAKQWLKGNNNIQALAQSLAEGLSLADYNFDKHKATDKDKIKIELEEVYLDLEATHRNKFKKAWETGLSFAQGTKLARDLVNEPAGFMTPTFLATVAQTIANPPAGGNKNITVKILEKEQIAKMGMNAFLAVAQGSEEAPKFIHLVYRPARSSKQKIALVGKGITFDSGGLNIKPGDSMEQMKIDMGGAATVLGVFEALDVIKPKVEVHGIVAACENMPSGVALKPGDVVTNMQGKTIEIGNTDAEGRVTLADSLAYAQKQGAKTIVDFATLTGACLVALGSDYAALYANNVGLNKDLIKAADIAGEKMWPMPMPVEYKDLNKSNIADIKNIPSTRYGGSITAAMFLQEFVKPEVAWAHLDIAGPAYAEKPLNSYTPVGGVGFGVRTVLEWLSNL
ncbi:leucyl aminopeptidase [bacterium]|nr:leucyl aminopeptidase [bacterium]